MSHTLIIAEAGVNHNGSIELAKKLIDKAAEAGVDIVLGPRYFTEAFDAVMAAVNNGTISEERINQSVRRILKLRKERAVRQDG